LLSKLLLLADKSVRQLLIIQSCYIEHMNQGVFFGQVVIGPAGSGKVLHI